MVAKLGDHVEEMPDLDKRFPIIVSEFNSNIIQSKPEPIRICDEYMKKKKKEGSNPIRPNSTDWRTI